MTDISENKAAFLTLVARFNGWQAQPLKVLLNWINNDSAVARALTVDPSRPMASRTVNAWRTGERVPSKSLGALLYVLSDGSLTPNLVLSDEWQKIISRQGWAK